MRLTTLDLVSSLVDQSLLQRTAGPDGESRYLMLETVRAFASDRLEACGEAETMRARHAGYFADRVEVIAPYLEWRNDSELAGPLARVDAELDNVRAAMTWANERGDATAFLRLAVAMQSYWVLRGRAAEGRTWLDRAVAVCETVPLPLRAAVVRAAGWIARHQGDYARAEWLGEQGLALSRRLGDPTAVVHALNLLGWTADEQGQFARARAFHEEALALGRRLADPAWSAWSMRNIGKQIFTSGDHDAAERWLEQALALFRREGHRHGAAITLHNLGEVALRRGEPVRSAVLRREWLELDWDAPGLRWCLEGMVAVAVAAGEAESAARLLGAAEAHRMRLGVALFPRQVPEYERNVADARNTLGEAAFATAWADGRRLSADEARAEALRVIDAIAGAAAQEPPAGLRTPP